MFFTSDIGLPGRRAVRLTSQLRLRGGIGNVVAKFKKCAGGLGLRSGSDLNWAVSF